MRVILVPVADRPECAIALAAAFELAAVHGANVVGCHVRAARAEVAAKPPGKTAGFDRKSALRLFAARAAEHGFRLVKRPQYDQTGLALWHEMVGTPARVLKIVGPVADLSVLSRPKPRCTGPAREFLLAALLQTGRPMLVLPQKRVPTPGRRILIAWNESADAAAAAAAALPILGRAERIVLFCAGNVARTGPKASYMADYLMHWGIRCERQSSRGRDVERELLDASRDIGADLLVMGAYSRNRLQELIFGGTTETMLFKADIPVFMLHR